MRALARYILFPCNGRNVHASSKNGFLQPRNDTRMRAIPIILTILLLPLASASIPPGESWIIPAHSPWQGNCRTFASGTYSFAVSGTYVARTKPGEPDTLALADAWGSSNPWYMTWAASPHGLNVAVIPTWQSEATSGSRPNLLAVSGFYPDPAHAYSFDVSVGASFARICMWIEDPAYAHSVNVPDVGPVTVVDNVGGLVVRQVPV